MYTLLSLKLQLHIYARQTFTQTKALWELIIRPLGPLFQRRPEQFRVNLLINTTLRRPLSRCPNILSLHNALF